MHRTARAVALVWVLALVMGCEQDTPTAASESSSPSLATTSSSCPATPGHPGGTILDKVDAPSPWGIAVRDDGVGSFTELYNGGIGFTSTRTRTIDGFTETGLFPTGIAFSPDGSTAYVANQGSSNISIVSVATRAVTGTIDLGGYTPFAVQTSADGSQLFIGTSGTALLIADVATKSLIGQTDVGAATNAFTVAPDNRILYVSSFVGGTVTEIDMFTHQAIRTFAVGGTPQGLALNRKATHLYVGNEQGYLNDIDLRAGSVGANIPLAGGAFGVGVTPDDNQAFIAIPSQGLVQVFGLQSRKLSAAINVGGDLRRLAFSQSGKIGAVTNQAGYITFIR